MNKFKVAFLIDPHVRLPSPSGYQIEIQTLKDIAEISIVPCKAEKDVLSAVLDADAILVYDWSIPITSKVIESGKKLKAIAVWGVGTDNIDVQTALKKGVTVAGVNYCVDEVADHTMALLLALWRKLTLMISMVSVAEWDYKHLKPIYRLREKTFGLIGLGKIGKAVAVRAASFGLNIIGYDPYVSQNEVAGIKVRMVDFEDLLVNSDIISLHVSLTPETRNLIGEKEIQKMKKGVLIINTSRGEVIQEKALIDGLITSHIGGVALDVFWKEPLPKNHQLVSLKNVILTPHLAWYSEEALRDKARKAAENIKRVLMRSQTRI